MSKQFTVRKLPQAGCIVTHFVGWAMQVVEQREVSKMALVHAAQA